jgi:hypothetical protein
MNLRLIVSALAITVTIPTTLTINSPINHQQSMLELKHVFSGSQSITLDHETLNLLMADEEIGADQSRYYVKAGVIVHKDMSLKYTLMTTAFQSYIVREYVQMNRIIINKYIDDDLALTRAQMAKIRVVKNKLINQRKIIQTIQKDIRNQLFDYRQSLTTLMNDQSQNYFKAYQNQYNILMDQAFALRGHLQTLLGQLKTIYMVLMNYSLDGEHLDDVNDLFNSMMNQIMIVRQDFIALTNINRDLTMEMYNLYTNQVDVSLYPELIEYVKEYTRLNQALIKDGLTLLKNLLIQVGNYLRTIDSMVYYNQLQKQTLIHLNTILIGFRHQTTRIL